MTARIRFLAAACAAACAAPAGAQPARPADAVPPTAFAFVTVKVADVWDADALKPVREVLAKADTPLAERGLENALGIAPAEVERVTLFWPALGLGPVEPTTLVLLTTRKPYNEAKVLKALKAVPPGQPPGHRDVRYAPKGATAAEPKDAAAPPPIKKDDPDPCGGAPQDPPAAAPQPAEKADDGSSDGPELFGLSDGPFGAVFLLDDRTLLFLPVGGGRREGSELGLVTLVGQLMRRRADGPLSEALALADKHTAVAAVRIAQADAALGRAGPIPPEVVPFRSLLKARTLTLTADVGADAKLTARLAFADQAAARRAEPVLKTLLQFFGEAVAAGRKEVERDEERAAVYLPLIDLVAKALDKTEVKADGAAVTAAVSVEFGPAVAKLTAAAPQAIEALATRTKSLNNLKMIGLAIHNHHDAMGYMPTDVLDPKTGRSLLSWRVQILPYVEQDALYRRFDLTKPWDDPANKKLLEEMPEVFKVYGRETKGKGLTYLQMPSSDKPIPGGSPIKVRGRRVTLATIVDGTSNTFMVVEAADPVQWTKPDDLPFDGRTVPKLGSPARNRFLALFGDGSVREFKRDRLTDDQLRALITADGGEVVNIPDR